MNPPVINGATSFTTSTRTGLSNSRCMARLTRGSSNGGLLAFIQVVNHALVELRGGQTRRCSRLAGRGRIERARVIHSPRQNGGPQLRRKWQEMIDFDAIEVGQAFVPVVRVSFHHPDFVLDPALSLKGTGTRDVEDLAEIVIILFKRLLAEDHVPPAGEGGHHEIDRTW